MAKITEDDVISTMRLILDGYPPKTPDAKWDEMTHAILRICDALEQEWRNARTPQQQENIYNRLIAMSDARTRFRLWLKGITPRSWLRDDDDYRVGPA